VTGATGLLGNNLVREMLRTGVEPVCLVRFSSDQRTLAGLSVPIVSGPWENDAFLRQAVSQVDAIVHGAAKLHIGWRNVEESIDTNVGLTTRISKLALERGIRIVHVSTVDTLAAAGSSQPQDETALEPAKPACAYVISKRLAEAAILREVEQGLDAVIVNPGFMLGPWDWKPSSGQMILALSKGFIPLAPAGGCSVVDVRDVCRGILAALSSGRTGERYILGGSNIAYFDLWREISTVVGRRPPLARLFAPVTWLLGGGGDLWARISGREGLLNSATVRMGQMFHYYSSEKAIRELDYKIGSYQTALADAWDWFVDHQYVATPKS
jgi:nucleoside-diphosphate-sugar epimerase